MLFFFFALVGTRQSAPRVVEKLQNDLQIEVVLFSN